LDPKYANAYYNRGNSYTKLGDYQQAVRDFDRAIEVFNGVLKLEPGFTTAQQWRANAFACKNMEVEAMRDVVQGSEASSPYDKSSMLAYYNAWFGHKEEATKYFEEAKRNMRYPENIAELMIGFYACCGDADNFFAWAPKAIEAKLLDPATIKYMPYLDRVRGDPRYAELLKELPS
jgi:tetratricopeptide (TPR) repeat protein